MAFILAFVFRAYIVEAFVIPTGSMAPTLLGQHVRADCPQCGYRFKTDGGDRSTAGVDLRCPMCFFPIGTLDENGVPQGTYAGDRILIQKYLYPFAEPHRFDVAVFKNPQNPYGGSQNYIKRIVGIPNETIGFLDGNLYRKPAGTGRWQVASKVDPAVNPRWEAIQRDVFQPIYHSRFVPKDGGNGDDRRGLTWSQPWKPLTGDWSYVGPNAGPDPSNPDAGTPAISALPGRNFTRTVATHGASAIVRDPNSGDGGDFFVLGSTPDQAAGLRFDFRPTGGYRADYSSDFARYAYNQPNGSGLILNWLEDLRLAATVRAIEEKPGDLAVSLGSVYRFKDQAEAITATVFTRGDAHGIELARENGDVITSARLDRRPFPHREPVEVEFWIVDHTMLMFIDGREVLRYAADVSFDDLLHRAPPPRPSEQQITITAEGGLVSLHDVELDRDLVYDDGGLIDPQRGTFPRDHRGNLVPRRANPVTLGPDQFFCVGDNSPGSEDSRKWPSVHRDVADAHFGGDRGPQTHGRVPRNLLMGRAFFVYYPAPSPVTANGPAIVPNFGEMRFIH